jgi:hypothetical protein
MDFEPYIRQFADSYGLIDDLFRAQIIQESAGLSDAFRFEPAFYRRYIRGNPHAKTPAVYGPLAACSYGLMQIMLETAWSIGFNDRPEVLFDTTTNLKWGCTYMRFLLDAYHENYPKALAAYNGGPGAVLNGPPYRTQDYVNAVYSRAHRNPNERNV